jgi:L-fuconolactonase
MLIDSHQHFWQIADRQGQWPPEDLASIHRDFGPADLQPTLERCGIDGTVLVQSLPDIRDTEFMLRLASQHPFVLGVVGWVDMKSADAAAQIERLATHRQLKGLRPMLQDLADDRWIDDPALDPAVHAMLGHQLSFDALVLPRHLPALLAFARRYPSLPVVIDHAAKPEIAHGKTQPWRSDIAALADLPNVWCKLSGMLTEAGTGADVATLEPYVEHVLTLFGTERVMWGSDWPVLRLAADYDGWLAMARGLCESNDGVDAAAMAAIFGGNARRFYRL